MSTHNICFCREIRKILCGYPLLSVAMLVLYNTDIGDMLKKKSREVTEYVKCLH